ncbi:uncharacterized protein LOC128860920 isoform X1 [Anastrepha ludens]|uniref:uncharacterized protein LOC128860920 isoform X1 n=1 Tax=Anastrepha ludens TaxID=28586 RepID=UPI0023AF7DC9|nr:uncharacterized protein LOC128860920 isoform X1 [Anastrepha ludens]
MLTYVEGNENFPNRLDDDDFPSTSRVALQNLEYDIDSGDDSVFFEDLDVEDVEVDSYSEDRDSNLENAFLLSTWAVSNNIPQNSVDDLLRTLKLMGVEGLPLSARSLLGTSRQKVNIKLIPGGEFLYIGIQFYLWGAEFNVLENCEVVNIDIGINGLKLFKSSNRCLWPILGYVVGSKLGPFTIACFSGMSKPGSVNDFLRDFCEEVSFLRKNGVKVGSNLVCKPFNIRLFSCDAPARAFVTGVKSHTAKNSCSKCTIEGVYTQRRVSFPKQVGNLRSDSALKSRIDLSYHSLEFKQAGSLLESFNFGMVSQFPLEPMHLVDLGVTKKLLQLLIKKGNVTKMNEKRLLLNRFVPSKFSRLSRDLDQISNWKSTEFRQFLLYTGIFVLKDCINEDLYYHFLLLHAGIRFLSCEKSFNVESNVANELLKEFVDLFGNIYCDHLISYNVHGLLHLSDCVREFGPLDNFSAYKFENYMQHLKKIINKPNKILQQMFFRISERLKISDSSKLSKNDLFIIDFNKDKDSYFQCNKGPIKIVGLDKETNSFKALLISNLENYFIEPVESMSGLGICIGEILSNEILISRSDISYKYFCINDRNKLILVPILHNLFRSFF